MKKLFAFGTVLLAITMASAQSLTRDSLELTRPLPFATLTNNMPVLTWLPVKGYSYEVWIDQIKMASGLRNDWKVLSSILTDDRGPKLTKKKIDVSRWKTTSLPATALSVMVRNGLYPNPYLGTTLILMRR